MTPLDSLAPSLGARFSGAILESSVKGREIALAVRGDRAIDILAALKEEGFNFLADLTAVDNLYLGGTERFAVVYHLLSHSRVERAVVKAFLPEERPSIASAVPLWGTADWQEREAFDLYGITFEGHPNLVRLMNPDYIEGHPLRKDYPRQGVGERRHFPVIERRIGTKSGGRL